MNIGITGASGFIGRQVLDLALRRGHEVIAFSRDPSKAIPGCEMRLFSLDGLPDLTGCEAIIHLAGESVVGLWTPAKKKRIVESRVMGTRRVVEAIARLKVKPEVLVCGSAVGFYGDRGEEELTESSPPGSGFLAETVQKWEAEAQKMQEARLVLLRTGVVLGKGGGAFSVMKPIFQAGLGGTVASGRQWVPWIHRNDAAALALFGVENLDIAGPLNATAPWPVRNAALTEALAAGLGRPALFRIPAWTLRLMGDFSRELLDSKKVMSQVAAEHSFPFRYPELKLALDELLGRGESVAGGNERL